MSGRAGRQRGLGVHHRRQRLPRHAHARAAVLRERARLRHHGDHRLALPHRLVDGERILRRRLHARVVLQHAHPRLAVRGHLAAGHHGDHARAAPPPRRCRWPTMRAWACGERTKAACSEARDRDVVGVGAAARRPAAPSGAAPPSGRCSCRPASPAVGRRWPRSARAALGRARDRLDDGVIAGAAAVVGAEGLADGRRVGTRLALQQLVRGEQHARRAEAALQRVLRAEGLLQVGERAAARPAPSIVSTRQPSAWAASIRQPRTSAPSTRTVHAPHTPCSQPTCEPVSSQLVAEEVDEVLARLDLARDRRAVDGQRDLHARASTSRLTTRASSTRGQVPAQGRGAVDVAGRIEVGVERAPRRGERAGVGAPAGQRGLGAAGAHRAACRRRRRRAAPRRCASPLDAHARGEAGEREVAVAARQLLEAPAPPGAGARAPRSR